MRELVTRAASGDEAAWDALCEALERALASQPRRIILDVLARLRANRFERLELYIDARQRLPDLTLDAWLAVIAARAAIDDARTGRARDRPTVRYLLELAATQLPEPALSAIELWVEGVPLPVIAHELRLGDAPATIDEAIVQLSSKIMLALATERQRAEARRERELACARVELALAAGQRREEHLRHCAPCRGVAETIELSLRE